MSVYVRESSHDQLIFIPIHCYYNCSCKILDNCRLEEVTVETMNDRNYSKINNRKLSNRAVKT